MMMNDYDDDDDDDDDGDDDKQNKWHILPADWEFFQVWYR